MTPTTPQVGIFWCYRWQVIAKSIPVTDATCDSLGRVDTAFSHLTEWETNRIYLPRHKMLLGTEYQQFPRGRVIYDTHQETFSLFADKSIITDTPLRLKVLEQFRLLKYSRIWRSDPHYAIY